MSSECRVSCCARIRRSVAAAPRIFVSALGAFADGYMAGVRSTCASDLPRAPASVELLAYALGTMLPAPNREPTRSVLYRSAAAIAARMGNRIDARLLADEGLRGTNVPEEIRAELLAIRDGG